MLKSLVSLKSLRFFSFLVFFFVFSSKSFAFYTAKEITVKIKGTDTTSATPAGTTAPTGTSVGTIVVCSIAGVPNQDFCLDQTAICSLISTTQTDAVPLFLCTPAGIEYCEQDSDCTALGRGTCLEGPSSQTKFNGYVTGQNKYFGICGSLQATSESNVMSDALCSGIKLVTGKAGRAFVAICVVVLGVLFFTGKISWNMILAAGLGCGAIFGAPSIVGVVTGKKLTCN